jgi:prepilin-type N-terminal cleavage/methylation domain-containing protein
MVSRELGGLTQARSDSMSYDRKPQPPDAQNGFSLMEMLVVIAIIMILAGMAIINISGTRPSQQSAAGLNAAVAVFRQGRDGAIAQRRNYQLVIPPVNPPNQIGLERLEIPVGFTTLPVVTLPAPAQFGLDGSIATAPEPGAPMCSNGLCFGGTPTQTWLSDGTFTDASGAPLNAAIYVLVPGDPSTQRAFTILGTTGRIRTYKWTGGSWVLQ